MYLTLKRRRRRRRRLHATSTDPRRPQGDLRTTRSTGFHRRARPGGVVIPSDRHDVRSLDVARLAHFTHCGKPPSKVNGRYDACALLHREWRETWARVAAESGVVVGEG